MAKKQKFGGIGSSTAVGGTREKGTRRGKFDAGRVRGGVRKAAGTFGVGRTTATGRVAGGFAGKALGFSGDTGRTGISGGSSGH